MLNPEHIQHFLAVVKYQSLTRAAGFLHVSHSTVSRSISNLEKELGAELLVRGNRIIRLTEAGSMLAERGPQVLSELDDIKNEIMRLGFSDEGTFTIASVNFFSPHLFEIYKSVLREHPGVNMVIRQMSQKEVIESVLSGDADVGVAMSFAAPDDLEPLRVMKYESGCFCIAVPKGHRLATRDCVDIRELRGEVFLQFGDQSFELVQRIVKTLSDSNILNYCTDGTTMESVMMEVRAGVGAALLPEHVASQFTEGCVRIPLRGIDTAYDILILSRKDNRKSFLKTFNDSFQE